MGNGIDWELVRIDYIELIPTGAPAGNAAPTAVTLIPVVAGIAEDTLAATKVADIAVTDDGQGANTFALTGEDASLFEIVGNELFLKAGQTLDATANPTLDVAVTVNDASVGADPDAVSALLSIPVSEAGAAPSVSVGVGSSTTEGDPAAATLTLSEASDQPITVTLVLSSGLRADPATIGAAAGGGDLAFDAAGLATLDVTIPADSLSVDVPFSIFQDDLDEADFETYEIAITAANVGASIDGAAEQVAFTPTPAEGGVLDDDAPVTPDQIVLRINAFGPEVAATDGSGVNWLADLKDVSGTPANENSVYLDLVSSDPAQDRGDIFGYTGSAGAIPSGVPEAVLDTARSSNAAFSYDIPVGDIGGPGTFRVNLYFAELFGGNQTVGKRVFDIGVEGDLATGDNFDPSAPNGGGDLRVVSYEVTVVDGVLNIDFAQELAANGGADNPIINAIEIVRLGAPTPDETPPTAAITLTNPADADAALGVSVALSDASGIDTATLGAGDLAVTAAAGAVTYLGFANGVATYSVAAPAGGWIDGETITVELKAGEVDDLAVPTANTNAATSQSLTLDIGSTGIGNAEEAFAAQDDIVKDATYGAGVSGSAVLEIMTGDNNIQSSNFGANSFEVTNTGDKKISAIFIDVSSALYQDSVFDPDGLGGDNAAKSWQINSAGGTGAFISGNGYFLPGVDPIPNSGGSGGASNGGFKGAMVKFDASSNGGFQNGEVVGFSGDMDPNSIAGMTKLSVDGSAILSWDVGGISGHELIGSLFTVLFDDGTTASGQLASDGSSAGSRALATQGAAPAAAPGIAVNGFQPGQNGTYGGTLPTITVTGTPGDKVQITMTKGFNPVVETDNGIADLVEARLARYDFKANNAFDAQTKIVTIGADGTFDASTLFDYDDAINNNVGSGTFPGDDVAQIGFVATKVQNGGAQLPIGPTTAPIYLTNVGGPVTGDPTGGTGGGADGYFQIVGSGPAAYFKMEIEDARIANGGENPGGKWNFVNATDEAGRQNGFTGDGYYVYGSNTSTAINGVLGSEVLEFTILVPEGETGLYEFQFRVSRDGTAAGDQQNDLWLNFKAADKAGAGDIEDYLTNTTNEPEPLSNGYIKIFGGPNNGSWGLATAYDGLPANPTAQIAIAESGLYTIQIAGRSQGFHVDSFWLEKISGSGPVASSPNSAFVSTGPSAPQISGTANAATVADGATSAFDVNATDLNGDTLTYSISGGADADLFEIDGGTGVVSFKEAPDFSAPDDAGGNNVYDVQVTVSDPGGLTDVRDYAVTVTEDAPGGIAELRKAIVAGSDDTDQNAGAGTVNLTKTDLELGDGGRDIGLRFTDLDLESLEGVDILDAYIQFTARSGSSGAINATVKLQDTVSAATFSAASGPTDRDTFDFVANWTDSSVPAAGSTFRTDDLSDLIEAFVAAKSADLGTQDDLAFIIEDVSGVRKALSFEGDAAPELVLIFQEDTILG